MRSDGEDQVMRGELVKHLLEGLSLAGTLGLLVMGVVVAMAARPSPFAARTDLNGGTEVIRLSEASTPDLAVSQDFVKKVSVRLFSWDETTLEDDRSYVERRVSSRVWNVLAETVPGYQQSLNPSTRGRVDVEIETTRVISDQLPFQFEIVAAIEFGGDYLPPGLGTKDTQNPRKERYGFVLTVDTMPRWEGNPHGLAVTDIALVTIAEVAS